MACSPVQAPRQTVTLDVARLDPLYLADGLESAASQFQGGTAQLGRSTAAARTGAGGKGTSALPAVALSVRDTPYRVVRDLSVALTSRSEWPVGAQTAVIGTVSAGAGTGRFDLPQGIGVFEDSARVDVTGWGGSVSLGLRQTLGQAGPLQASLSLSRGAEIARSRISVQSALLDVRAAARTVTPFTALELSLAAPALTFAGTVPHLKVTARRYDGRGYAVQGTLSLPLQGGRP